MNLAHAFPLSEIATSLADSCCPWGPAQAPAPPQERFLTHLAGQGASTFFLNLYHDCTLMASVLISLPGLLGVQAVSVMYPGPGRDSVNIC